VIALVISGMATRAIVFGALVSFLFIGVACADEIPNLIGSSLKTENAIAKSQTVFIGQLVSLGERDNSVDHESLGQEYENAKIKLVELLKGTFDAHTTVGIYSNAIMLKEETPHVGETYIFFVAYAGNASNPFIVIKLLTATNDSVFNVKKLIPN